MRVSTEGRQEDGATQHDWKQAKRVCDASRWRVSSSDSESGQSPFVQCLVAWLPTRSTQRETSTAAIPEGCGEGAGNGTDLEAPLHRAPDNHGLL
jgi:hypothetical protein